MQENKNYKQDLASGFNTLSNFSIVMGVAAMVVLILGFSNSIVTYQSPIPPPQQATQSANTVGSSNAIVFQNLWQAPDISTISVEQKDLILYGKELIANTSIYLGPKGKVMKISNGLNCQNCHLAAGTQPFGNNYAAVAATYPQIRARSGKMVDVKGRINACFQRSLNGEPLPLNSKELNAIEAYIEWLGKDVPEGKIPEGAGLYPLAYLDRAADPQKGKLIYNEQCTQCHGANGEGMLNAVGDAYVYPPLWGEHSYNVGAGLYRIEKFARFVKTNMPYGVSHKDATLTDEEAWDIAAFVNSQPHPVKDYKKDWMNNLADKPMDAPFGPYLDGFSEQQHKYGPYPPIKQAIAKLKELH